MRIIAGEHRGRHLESPAGDVTRPITDRAKQSLFDVLSPQIEGAQVVDLFAGTGSMGLECLSRGAVRARFFEADRAVVAGLRRNIAALRLEAASEVFPGDLFKLFAAHIAAPGHEAATDILFLDPPYRFLVERPGDLLTLSATMVKTLTPDGIVSFRHDTADHPHLPGLTAFRSLVFGSMTIELLRKAAQFSDKSPPSV